MLLPPLSLRPLMASRALRIIRWAAAAAGRQCRNESPAPLYFRQSPGLLRPPQREAVVARSWHRPGDNGGLAFCLRLHAASRRRASCVRQHNRCVEL